MLAKDFDTVVWKGGLVFTYWEDGEEGMGKDGVPRWVCRSEEGGDDECW